MWYSGNHREYYYTRESVLHAGVRRLNRAGVVLDMFPQGPLEASVAKRSHAALKSHAILNTTEDSANLAKQEPKQAADNCLLGDFRFKRLPLQRGRHLSSWLYHSLS